MRNFFIDTEFMEATDKNPLTLISLGIYSDERKVIYLEHKDCDLSLANDWVKANVVPHLGPAEFRLTFAEMREVICHFIPKTGEDPQFWGYYAAFDWVLFCDIFGGMMKLPENFPTYCLDLKQYAWHLGITGTQNFPKISGVSHNALNDARWHKAVYDYLTDFRKRDLRPI